MFTTEDQSTVIPKQFLWAVGLNNEIYPPGSLIQDRYRVVEAQVVMDTKMYSMPEMPEDLTELAIKYLKLTRYSLHLPQPYALLKPQGHDPILILQNPPLDDRGQLLPSLATSWAEASPLRQVNWLWQLCKLWKPFQENNVSRVLLDLQKIRTKGCWIQILELDIDETNPELPLLGDALTPLLETSAPEITDEFKTFLDGLQAGTFSLDRAIEHLDRVAGELSQANPMWVRIASSTDVGTRREHNEDSCYPMADQPQIENLRNRLLIICDGLGGHEGGEVASSMTIKTLTRLLNTLLNQVENDSEPFSAQSFITQLDKIVRVANDQIVTLNDQQQRLAQQRMGTTLVMAVVPHPQGRHPQEVYIVHVGDSRAYWIDTEGYHQITADDDVATRETVLGYSFYPYSAQRVDAGALIQALGTRPSNVLLPRIQRFLIDEDCLFLLCSDGLSDYDRIDYIWESHLKPILTKDIPLDIACNNLIAQANLLNGHDNVTVGLLRCRFGTVNEPQETEPDQTESITILQERTDEDELAELAHAIQSEAIAAGIPEDPIAPYTPPVKEIKTKDKSSNHMVWLIVGALGITVILLVLYLYFQSRGENNSPRGYQVPSVQELT